MASLLLFYRLMLRPLFKEPVRASLSVLAVALGVGVVLAIDLAGNAATGSFRSSMETLAGNYNLEIVSAGGVPDRIVAALTELPYPITISPRVEDVVVLVQTKESLPLIGLDLLAESSGQEDRRLDVETALAPQNFFEHAGADNSVWVGESMGYRPGARLQLLINDQIKEFIVCGAYPDSHGRERAIIVDIATAQRVLKRYGRVDRILLKVGQTPSLDEWQKRLRAAAPAGVEVRTQGAGTDENRRMLASFRWNLRLLSYISLIVGAFLIYNTISVSVVRRRPEIGIVRALGASQQAILAAFVGEAAIVGMAGAAVGIPLGRMMALGAVKLMAATVDALYVSSRPGAIELGFSSMLLAFVLGAGVAIASAYAPAREASFVSPVEAMARGRREFDVRVRKNRDFLLALGLSIVAAGASRVPALGGKPIFGYLAAMLLIVASALAMPAFVDLATRSSSKLLWRLIGVEGLLASRSVGASLRRTSVLVAALSTAIAMMTSVGIMVGSFRETVMLWINDELPADLYLHPAGHRSADRHPAISVELADKISKLPGVAWVDRLRAYEISYEGMPATLSGVDLRVMRPYHHSDFFSGRSDEQVLANLRDSEGAIVSEPFAYKHHLKTGDSMVFSLGGKPATFRIIDVYYDYSSERGNILVDRSRLLRYLPDPAPSNIAVYIEANAQLENVRTEIGRAAAGYAVVMFANRELRQEALRVFDRTFAVTYALEAVAVVVAVMGVAGALLALVIDRRRELGLLRFLGAARGQVRKLILVEAALLGLLANCEGLVLGFFISLILIFVINKQSFGWTIRFHWPVAVLLGAISLVYSATILAGLYPAEVATRLKPIEVVHEE